LFIAEGRAASGDEYPQTFTKDCTVLYSFLFENSGLIPVWTIIILYFYSQPTSLQAILCFGICKYIRPQAPSENGRVSLEYMWKEFGMSLAQQRTSGSSL
jgi:hypothetical protein